MPKRVDHDERRRQIAEALWRIASTRGLQAVSLREVAAEAGLSMRLVQYYCKTKHQMLLSALDHLNERSEQRARERIGSSSGPQTPWSTLRSTLIEILPLDADRRLDASVYLAYYVRALTDPDLAALFRASRPLLEEDVAGKIGQAQVAGDAAPEVDARFEAQTLLAVARNLGGDILLDSRTFEEALALLDYHLDRIFPPELRTPGRTTDDQGKLGAKNDQTLTKVGKRQRKPER
jgi:AcrR family transcriptional regulator